MKMKIKAIVLFFFLLLILNVRSSLAAVRCETQYGGGEVCVRTGELQIDKKVWDAKGGSFVDNLGLSDYKYVPGEEFFFKLKIKNVGDQTFDKVYVKDTLPEYLELISGNLEFDINNLGPGEAEEKEFKVRVVAQDKFPSNKAIICLINNAEAWSGDEKDKDTSQVCLEKKVLGVAVLPPTGPKDWEKTLAGSFLSLIISIYFLKTKYSIKKERG